MKKIILHTINIIVSLYITFAVLFAEFIFQHMFKVETSDLKFTSPILIFFICMWGFTIIDNQNRLKDEN